MNGIYSKLATMKPVKRPTVKSKKPPLSKKSIRVTKTPDNQKVISGENVAHKSEHKVAHKDEQDSAQNIEQMSPTLSILPSNEAIENLSFRTRKTPKIKVNTAIPPTCLSQCFIS